MGNETTWISTISQGAPDHEPFNPNWYPASVTVGKWLGKDGRVYHEAQNGVVWVASPREEWVINATVVTPPMWTALGVKAWVKVP